MKTAEGSVITYFESLKKGSEGLKNSWETWQMLIDGCYDYIRKIHLLTFLVKIAEQHRS